jgi:circadian clock protein KaiB
MEKQEPVDSDGYLLTLFVTGASPNSIRAIANIKRICEQYLDGTYSLEIVDVYQQPLLAQQQHLIALPMLLKSYPLPQMRLIGDMSNTQKVLKGLGKLNEITDGITENL